MRQPETLNFHAPFTPRSGCALKTVFLKFAFRRRARTKILRFENGYSLQIINYKPTVEISRDLYCGDVNFYKHERLSILQTDSSIILRLLPKYSKSSFSRDCSQICQKSLESTWSEPRSEIYRDSYNTRTEIGTLITEINRFNVSVYTGTYFPGQSRVIRSQCERKK